MPRQTTEPQIRRRRDGAARRDAILDAALRCFDRAGLLRVGIEDVRREAGASPSSMYHQFADLEELTVALLVRVFDALFAHLAARVTATKGARAAVLALVDGHIEWIVAHPREGRFMYQAMTLEGRGLLPASRARLIAAKAAALAPVVAHLGRFIARGELPAWSPTWLDVVLLGVAHEALRRWLAGEESLAPALLRARLPPLAWSSVRALARFERGASGRE